MPERRGLKPKGGLFTSQEPPSDKPFFLNKAPLEFAKDLHKTAALHKGWMWAVMMEEAACVIEQLAKPK